VCLLRTSDVLWITAGGLPRAFSMASTSCLGVQAGLPSALLYSRGASLPRCQPVRSSHVLRSRMPAAAELGVCRSSATRSHAKPLRLVVSVVAAAPLLLASGHAAAADATPSIFGGVKEARPDKLSKSRVARSLAEQLLRRSNTEVLYCPSTSVHIIIITMQESSSPGTPFPSSLFPTRTVSLIPSRRDER
jgi:hypothetical protein